MGVDIQHISVTKRVSAFLLDTVLLLTLAVGFCTALFWAVDYDGYTQTVQQAYQTYGQQYGVELPIDQPAYQALPEAERAKYNQACDALYQDAEAIRAKKMSDNLPLLVVTVSLLLANLLLELMVPLLFKNGQTLGKKMLAIAVIRKDGVKINAVQLFVRTFLGKFTIGTMVPTYIVIMILTGQLGLLGTVVLGILVLAQLILLLGHDHALIQDRMANTLVVDMNSQQIFDSEEALLEYTKRIHAEMAERAEY